MTDTFVFHPNPPLGAIYNRLETPAGLQALYKMDTQFSSLVDCLQHTNSNGHSTFVHLPDGETLSFVNVGPKEFVHAAIAVSQAIGGKII